MLSINEELIVLIRPLNTYLIVFKMAKSCCQVNCENNYDIYHYPPKYTPWKQNAFEVINTEIVSNSDAESNQYNYSEEMSEKITFCTQSQSTSSKKYCTERSKNSPKEGISAQSPIIQLQQYILNQSESNCKVFNNPDEVESSLKGFEVFQESEFKASPRSEYSVISNILNQKQHESQLNLEESNQLDSNPMNNCSKLNINIKLNDSINKEKCKNDKINCEIIEYPNVQNKVESSCIVHGMFTEQNSSIISGNKLNTIGRFAALRRLASPDDESKILSDRSSKQSMICLPEVQYSLEEDDKIDSESLCSINMIISK